MDGIYSVVIEDFAEKHFIKNFKKKYKDAWNVTERAIISSLERVDALLLTDRAETICSLDGVRFIKTKFKVATTQESAKTSGNRCIVIVDDKSKMVSILLVYSKTDLSGHNETSEWKQIIKDNYPKYKKLL